MKYLMLLFTAFLCVACDSGERAYQRSEEIETFADPQIQAYEKARDVQGMLDEVEEKQRKAIDSQ